MFNLEQAIADWRRKMAVGGIKSCEVLDELESHLREDVEQQMRSGAAAEQAFKQAVQRVGSADQLKLEFGKVERLGPAPNRTLINIGCGAMATFVFANSIWLLLQSEATVTTRV